jgi:hypothetical protein
METEACDRLTDALYQWAAAESESSESCVLWREVLWVLHQCRAAGMTDGEVTAVSFSLSVVFDDVDPLSLSSRLRGVK